jgi:hypothetical protein
MKQNQDQPDSVNSMSGDTRISGSSPLFRRPAGHECLPLLPSPPQFIAANGDYSAPFALIRLAVLAIVPFILVDAALYQLQMFVTGGGTPITPAVLKIGLLCAFVMAFLLRGKISNPPVIKIAVVFCAYLVFAALHQYFNLGIDLIDILLGYNAYYLLTLICVMALSTPVNIQDRLLVAILIALSVICGALGIAQYLTNSPIVRTSSTDGYFKVLVWSSLGRVRVFSLFTAPASCGAFFGFIGSLAVAMCRRRSNMIIAIPLLGLSLFLSWASNARTTIVGTICALIASWIITFLSRKDRTKWLPVLWLMGGIIIALYAYLQTGSGGLSTGLITDASSFAERFARWSTIVDMFRSTSFINVLLGYGRVQGEKLDPTGTGGSDNLYLALILHIGVIGLSLMMLLLWSLWQTVRKEAEARTSYLVTAVAAIYSTVFLTGIFDISSFGMIFVFFAISNKSLPLNDESAKGRFLIVNPAMAWDTKGDSVGSAPATR